MRRIAAICVVLSGLYSAAWGVTTGEFLNLTGSTRQDALGGGFSTMSSQVDSLGLNPAGLHGLQGMTGFLSYAGFFEGINYIKGAAANKFRRGTFAVAFSSWDSGTIESTSVDSSGNISKNGKVFGYSGQSLGLSYADTFFWSMSTGVTLKVVKEDLATRSFSTAALDLGAQKFFLQERLRVGLSLLNLGPGKSTDDGTGRTEYLPMQARAGVSYEIWRQKRHSVAAMSDFSYILEQGFQPHIGAEYTFMEMVSLRLGYVPVSTAENFTAGLGLKMESGDNIYAFDYAMVNYADLGINNRFTLKFTYQPVRLTAVKEEVEKDTVAKYYRLILKDGTDLSGEVIHESDSKIVLEVDGFGTVVANRSDIKEQMKIEKKVRIEKK